MIKLIFSDSFDPLIETGAYLIKDKAALTKQASTIFNVDYDALKPDKDHIGIHLIALGDFEHYGSNRNGDGFPKKACVKYHDTFVKHAHPFRHHKNKDPKAALGCVKAAAYNDAMGRIELFLHAHKEKAADELDRLEKEGTIPFSMACKVPHDRCEICNTLRKSASDPKQCDHIRYHLGEVFADGKVACTQNDEPDFFDISFVNRPADRIAWDLKKVATGGVISSLDLAREYHITLPEHLIDFSSTTMHKIALCKSLADFESFYNLEKQATASDRFFMELRKAVLTKAADSVINELRGYDPKDVFHVLAHHGVVMAPDTFFKYAFGVNYGPLAGEINEILGEIKNNLFSNLIKTGEYTNICSNDYFDVDILNSGRYITHIVKLGNFVIKNLAENLSLVDNIDSRVIDNTINGVRLPPIKPTEKQAQSDSIKAAASIYAAYKLSALKGVLDFNTNANKDAVIAMAAYQDLT